MSLEVIYVVRHGFRTSWSVDPMTGKYSMSIRSPTGIPNDPPLTSHGLEQSRELAAHLMQADPPIDQVYSSPYYRCMQTIQPFVNLRNGLSESDEGSAGESRGHDYSYKIRAEGGISEWFGAAHFEHPSYATLDVLRQYFPSLDTGYESAITRPPNGESASTLHQRVAKAMRAIIERSDREGKKAIILCSHAATVIALGRVLTGCIPEDLEEDDFKAFTCGLSVYRRRGQSTSGTQNDMAETDEAGRSTDQRSVSSEDWRSTLLVRGGWDCEANSDCSFLKNGPERGWRFSIDESFVDFGPPELLGQAAETNDRLAIDGSKL